LRELSFISDGRIRKIQENVVCREILKDTIRAFTYKSIREHQGDYRGKLLLLSYAKCYDKKFKKRKKHMKKNPVLILAGIVAWIALFLSNAGAELSDKDFSLLSNTDILQIQRSRNSMSDITKYIDSQPDLFTPVKQKDKNTINRDQRLSLWNTYQIFLDHLLTLDLLGQSYSKYYKASKGERKKQAFRISYAAFLAQYRYAMDYITLMEKTPDFHLVLNEPVPEIGLPPNTYSKLKFRFLNVLRGAEFARLNTVYHYYGKDPDLALTNEMENDISAIWKAGKYKGPIQTLQNAIQMLQDAAFTTWFPVQKGISTVMGNVRVRRGDDFLIARDQINLFAKELEPGDILLQRREWCLSNIGLPGFWTHAALYIGHPEQRTSFFNDPDVKNWIRRTDPQAKTIEELLKKHYPEPYADSMLPRENKDPVRVIEAIGEGVVFTSLEHSSDADSMVVLRPVLSKTAKARAVYRAFHFHGRPYDFNFDFLSDASLVCSEIIYKAYLPTDQMKGLDLPLNQMLGRTVLSPNHIARLFDKEYDSNPQLDFVLFYDGTEKENKAKRAGIDVFRKSWKRPKWHIIIKDSLLDQTRPDA